MRVWIKGVKGSRPSFSTNGIVIQWDVNLRHVLADVVTNLFTISVTELQIVLVELYTVLLVILIVRLLSGPQILTKLIPRIEPSKGSLILKVTCSNPERPISIPKIQMLEV